MARGKRGAEPTKSTAGSKYGFVQTNGSKPASWDGVSPEIVGEAVLAVLDAGDAMMVSTTSDGGAVRITLFEGDSKHSTYVHTPTELEAVMRGIAQSVDSL